MWPLLLCGGPFALVGILVCLEWAYVRSPFYPVSNPKPPLPLRWALLIECLALFLAVFNIPLMHTHLSAFSAYSRAPDWLQAIASLVSGLTYLVLLGAVFMFVLMIHLW
jgi:hypothetical protein